MNLRTYIEEQLVTLQALLQQEDSEIRATIDQWDQEDPKRLIFWQPATRFGHLSTEEAQGSELGLLSNQMPAGFRAHVEHYLAETKEILQACPNQDEQCLETEAGKRWGEKDPRFLLFRWFWR